MTRLLFAGFAAGVTNLILGFVLAHLVGVEKVQAALREHGLRVIGEPKDAVPHLVVRILMGFAVTALFLAVAPRFGYGPGAALVAAAFAWAFTPVFSAWGHSHTGLFPPNLAWSWVAVGAVEMLGTAFVGGWIATGKKFWN